MVREEVLVEMNEVDINSIPTIIRIYNDLVNNISVMDDCFDEIVKESGITFKKYVSELRDIIECGWKAYKK